MADPFLVALDTIYAHSGVDATIPSAPGVGGLLAVRALYAAFDPTNPPLGTEITEWRAGEDRAQFSFKRADVLDLPAGTLFEAPELPGGTVRTWKVESLIRKDNLELTVLARQVRP